MTACKPTHEKCRSLHQNVNKVGSICITCGNNDNGKCALQGKEWLLSIGKYYEGFKRKSVTPYMHILVYHLPKIWEA